MAADPMVSEVETAQTRAATDDAAFGRIRMDLQALSAELQGALWSAKAGGASEECRRRLDMAAGLAAHIADHCPDHGDTLLINAARLLGAFLKGRRHFSETDLEIARALVLVMETAASRHRPAGQFGLRVLAGRQIELIRQMIAEALALI